MNHNLEFKMNCVLEGLLFLRGIDSGYPFQLAEIYGSEPNMEQYKEIQEKWDQVISEFKETIQKKGKFWWSEKKIRRIAFQIKERIKPV